MKHIAGWFRRNNTLMAQAKDLARQLQEAWHSKDMSHAVSVELLASNDSLKSQLHRVARERDEERRLRLEAEDGLRDRYMENEALKLFVHMVHKDECASLLAGNKECDCGYDTLPDFELAQAAEELREHYLENEEEK